MSEVALRASVAAPRRFAGWRMVLLAMLAENCAAGLIFGVYGTTIVAMETKFGITRSLTSYCISGAVLMMGLCSPIAGELVQRVSARATFIAGAIYCALGFVGLLFANNIYVVIAIYTFVLGPSYALLGPVTTSTLVSRWFIKGRGRAIGLVNMPVGLFIVPPLAGALVARFGVDAAYIGAIVVALAMIPILWRVVSHPSDIGQAPLGEDSKTPGGGKVRLEISGAVSSRQILSSANFWVIMSGCALFTGASMTLATHVIPLVQERGFDLQRAATMLSVFGICGAAGAPVWGWLSDRLGPSRAYITASILQTGLWITLFYVSDSYAVILIVIALMGFSGSGSTVPLMAAALAAWLGPVNMGRGMGMGYFVKLPFLVGAPMLAGYLHDLSGSYQSALLVYIVALPIVAVVFLLRPIPYRSS